MDTTTRLRALVEPLVAEAGASIYDVEHSGGVLRITVDRDGGVDIGTIGSLTRKISHLLDEEDPLPGAYTLEVSSPGLERSLRTPEHFAGAVGSLVSLKTRAGVEGDRRVKGVLLGIADDLATIAPADAAPGTTRVLAIRDIGRAPTVFEWGPTPKPGSKPAGATKAPKPKGAKNGATTTASSAKKKAAKS